MNEKAIADLLAQDWETGLRITTIPQAMVRLGVADDLESRWDMATRLDALWHSTLATPEKVQAVNLAFDRMADAECAVQFENWRDQVITWDRASILLTDNEKLVARYISREQTMGAGHPSSEVIADAIGFGASEAADAIRMLAWLGYLILPNDRPINEYSLSDDHSNFNRGLGFSFHTIAIDEGDKFAVP